MGNASLPLSLHNLSEEKMMRFKEHPDLLEALDRWTLFADRRLIPQMRELGNLVKQLYTLPNELKLYRGFHLDSFQDSLGITEEAHLGQVIAYQTDERSLSFSTEESIAKAFGNIVVSTTLRTKSAEFLYITDELVVLVHQMRNLKDIKTQHEVILLPPMELQLKVVNFEKSGFGWLGW